MQVNGPKTVLDLKLFTVTKDKYFYSTKPLILFCQYNSTFKRF